MKILQVFDFLSLPHGGGTVDVVLKLSRALVNRGHEVTVCTGDYELGQNYLDMLGEVKINVFRSWFNRHGFYIMPSLVKLDVSQYDVIHLHCYRSFQNVVLCSKARMYKIPYIIDAHGSTVKLPETKQLIRKLYDRVFGYKDLKYASRVIAETEIGIEEYKALGVNSNKSVLLHPMLDIKEFAVLPEVGLFKQKHNIQQSIVLFVGRINWAKGIAILLEAIRGLDDVRLVIVGQDDGFKSELIKLAKERGMEVLFTGFLGGFEKLSALVDADVLVQPSMNEAGARPSLEAILCDTPVIVTKETGAGKEIEKFGGGYLVAYGNIVELRETIKYILSHRGEARKRTRGAREYIKESLSVESQLVKYEEIYREVIA